ncbi:metallophosphoesterase [Desulfonema magnum]|uniref:Metallophosphoesterase family protein n=1 Tax=Desulfonema magnum TaxID=45655 RepID=A0A975BJR9_9BACT|nr:metallophosphoesterase [Desulfonema magnum]QTA86716.1 Metallophosphoesterase family protein [Desulfonema magnum]
MIKFLIVFLSIYSLMHMLFFFRIKVLLPDGRLVQWLSFLFLFLMILMPINCRLVEEVGHDLPARMMAFVGFYWMGFIFLAFVGTLVMEIFDGISWGINRFTSLKFPLLSGKIPPLILLGVVTALCIYGSIEARDIRIERLYIMTDKLPAGTDHLRIVQISDVHLGLLVRGKRVKVISDKVQSLKPDILVCTGDLVDGKISHLPELTDLFRQIRPRYGKYAVTGNHEYYTGVDYSVEFTEKSGFTVLRGEAKTIPSLINIVGVDDSRIPRKKQEKRLLSSVQNGLFTLFLKHRPLVSEETVGLFDLQLSGHTHGGQIFPFGFIVSVPFPFLEGYYNIGKGSGLYTNRGTGTWGPQIRILSPPEITVIELKHKLPPLSDFASDSQN